MENSLAAMRPEIVTEWSPRNLPLSPENISYGSKKVYWWKGKCGHEWEASAKARSQGEKCPICSGKRIIPGINDLASLMPDLAAEWSPKNPMPAASVGIGSHKKAVWKGKCGHEWEASAKARSQGEKCPICSGKRIIPGINDLASLMPDLAAEWSPKNPVPAASVGIGSHKKAVWKGKCGHEWEAVIRSRAAGAGCPYCSHNRVLAGYNDLDYLFPRIAQEWSTANLPLLPWQVTAFANTKVWWICEKGHEWEALISTRSYGSQCPYCSGIKVLPGYNDLATTHPQLAREWSARNDELSPDSVNQKSTENVWWQCGMCGNEYKAVIKSRVQGLCCPVCAERAVMPGYNDLATTDPELVLEWDYEKNADMQPSAVSRNSMRPVWWKGACGHTWKDKIYNRTINKAGCIYCTKEYKQNLPRQIILRYAEQLGVEVLFDDADTIGIPLDVYIPALKLAVIFTKRQTDKEKRIVAIQEFLCHARGIECKVIPSMDNAEIIERKIKAMMRHAKEV